MINEKKTKKEKQATRREQNARAAKRKEEQGLKRVSLWMPKEALERAGNLNRIGIILAEEGADQTPAVYIRKTNGRLEAVAWQGNLLQTTNTGEKQS